MYSLGGRLSSGASEVRFRYSRSRRCIRNGTHASPLSTQITLSRGNRSGSPLISQFVMWTMLQCTKEIACIERKRFIVFIQSSSHVGPAWKASGSPVSSIAAYTGMYRLSCTGSCRMLVTRNPHTLGLPANSRIMRRHMSGSLRGRNGRNLSRGSWLQNSSTIHRL